MPLRLRILLLIGAINVLVLLGVVAVGLSTEPAKPVWPAATEEAFRVAESATPKQEKTRYVRFMVRLSAKGDTWEVLEPAGLKSEVEKVRRDLARRVQSNEQGVFLDRHGLAALGISHKWRAFYVGFNEKVRWEALGGLRTVFLFEFLGTILLIAVTYLILNRMVLAPLDHLAQASADIAAGNTPKPVPHSGTGDELDRLVDTFNHMAGEVREYQEHLEDRVLTSLRRVTAAESRLVLAQRLAATGTLAAGIAHEINNPLGGIANAVRRLQEGRLNKEKREEYFTLVQEGLERIRQIVERVLHFTPRQSEAAPLDAAEVCRRAVALARHRADRRGVGLEVSPAGPVRGLIGDAQELQQAVLNLLLNAIDAIPEGRPGTVKVSAARKDGEVVLEITDDGAGMDEETRRRCVDLFYSTKSGGEGSGLGLGIVQHIVTDHGGELEIDSVVGKGTTVRMRFPVESGA